MNLSPHDNAFEFLQYSLKQIGFDIAINQIKNKEGKTRIKINNTELTPYVVSEFYPNTLMFLPQTDEQLLLVANYISPDAKKLLAKKGINYLDGGGNMRIKLPGVHIAIGLNKVSPPSNSKKYQNRAFTKTGAAVVLQFLIHPFLINAPQRTIADYADVSLGTIPKVFKQLEEEGFIIKLNAQERQFSNRTKLLKKLIVVLNSKVMPANYVHHVRYTKGDARDFLKQAQLSDTISWGGEAAAAILTDFLLPEKISLFTNEKLPQLAKNYRLVPDNNGDIAIYKSFWGKMPQNKQCVHPIVIYAELIASADSRNLELAEMIYKTYIEPEL